MNYNKLKDFRLLIVEDELKILKKLKETLGDFFTSASTAENGLIGYKKFKSTNPSFIITDIAMPKCNGLEMAAKIREENKNIPIIVLSAFSEKEQLLKSIDIGINKYFIKPVDPEDVLDYLSDLASTMLDYKILELNNDFSFNWITSTLYNKEKKIIKLTKREKNFIHLLLEKTNLNKVVKIEILKKYLREGDKEISNETLRTFVTRLRKKTNKEFIKTIQKQGYIIPTE